MRWHGGSRPHARARRRACRQRVIARGCRRLPGFRHVRIDKGGADPLHRRAPGGSAREAGRDDGGRAWADRHGDARRGEGLRADARQLRARVPVGDARRHHARAGRRGGGGRGGGRAAPRPPAEARWRLLTARRGAASADRALPDRRPAPGMSARDDRIARLRESLEEPLLVSNPCNVLYLVGFRSSNAYLLVEDDRVRLFTDFRYAEARRAVPRVEAVETRRDVAAALAELLSGRIGFESRDLTYARYETLAAGGLELVPRASLVEELRAVKDEGELEATRAAARITSEA